MKYIIKLKKLFWRVAMSIQDIINERKIPELMRMKTGRKIKSVKDLEPRREELKIILRLPLLRSTRISAREVR